MEKIYFKMQHSGILNLIAGVSAMVLGLVIIISGVLLLKNKKDIMF